LGKAHLEERSDGQAPRKTEGNRERERIKERRERERRERERKGEKGSRERERKWCIFIACHVRGCCMLFRR
jgi:hypothetical protein